MNITDNLNDDSKYKKKNFFTSKTFPNYLLIISLLIILILIIVIIVVASSNSSSDSEKNSDSKSSPSNKEAKDDEENREVKEEEEKEVKGEEEGEEKEEEKEEGKEEEGKKEEEKEEEGNLTPWEKYIKAEKYLYIWEYYTPDYILKLCQDHHFTRVYLSIGCIEQYWDSFYSRGEFPENGEIGSLDYETFIKKLNNINVEVELVTFLGSDPNDFSEIDRATKVATMVKDLSTKVKIKALHFDQECGNKSSYENLLKMYKKINDIFPTSAILRPFWLGLKMEDLKSYFTDKNFYNNFKDCETLVDAIMKVTKYTDLMAYNQDYSVVIEYMEKLKVISSRHPDNEAKNIFEISGEDGVPEDDTLHQRYLEDHDKFFNFVYDSSKLYGGITIHYYETWYKTLYCIWPNINYDYDGGKPKEC